MHRRGQQPGARALEISDRVRQHFAATPVSGSLTIGILEGFATHGLPLLLACLRGSHPYLDLRVEAAIAEKLVLRPVNDGFDLVLGAQRKEGAWAAGSATCGRSCKSCSPSGSPCSPNRA